eukprot:CAMPEP_0177678244 /NCGR_PEP_ID=MMETSP0447-20121125/28904_1 /TAXON_ID=0 /ORGANISM="Stygamoeba regulata, Strain BSH-02190019" /LENGTH=60 /DNA_ID=CAMNT_0019187231 /DNA_START=290 /DNA_END=469 /DNA_ORIENTATION=-
MARPSTALYLWSAPHQASSTDLRRMYGTAFAQQHPQAQAPPGSAQQRTRAESAAEAHASR